MISNFRCYSLCCRVNISAITHPSVTEVTELFEIEDVKPEIEIEEVLEKKVATEEIKKEFRMKLLTFMMIPLKKEWKKLRRKGSMGP